jgi:hypothetical protein
MSDTDNDGFSDALEVAQNTDPKSASSIPNNFAPLGTGLMGIKDSLDSGPETEQEFYHVGTANNINDGNLTTRVDTYNDAGITTVSFVGIVWTQPVSKPIVNLKLTLATFYDGGWFGPSNQGPGAGGKLTTNYLTEPLVQISRDNGITWTTVTATSDYMTALKGHGIGGGSNPNPTSVTTTFTLAQPASGITGIRLIGTDSGTASQGFLGVFELAALSSSTDVDNDQMDDSWERQYNLNVGVNDAAEDPDADGLTNLQEYKANTDPKIADTDADGLKDGLEINQYKTNPLQNDTDGDGLLDGAEVNQYGANPLLMDSDIDGYADGLEVRLGSDPANPASMPDNISPLGTGILGVKESMESGPETESFFYNSGSAAAINDADTTTRVDTYNGVAPGTVSFVGIVWNQPVANPIVRLELTMAIFFDGGWFGVNNLGPGSGSTLSALEHLTEPIVQITKDQGTNWSTINATSDYMTALDGHPLPAVDYGDPTAATATFTLTQPQTGINGIRIIGSEGGTASGGFLGVFDLAAKINRPATTQGVQLVNVGLVNRQIKFEFDSKTGTTYNVQYKTSLSDAAWTSLTTITGDGSRKSVADNITATQRFYRVVNQ